MKTIGLVATVTGRLAHTELRVSGLLDVGQEARGPSARGLSRTATDQKSQLIATSKLVSRKLPGEVERI